VSVDPLELRAVDHGSVEADAEIATTPARYDAAEAGPEAAGHAGLERQLAWRAARGADRSHALEHAGRAAAVDGGAGLTVELLAEEIGDRAVIAGGPVVGGEVRLVKERGGERSAQIAEPEQHGRAAGERVAEDGQRSDADTAADEDRAWPLGGGETKAGTERPECPQAISGP
jgi:riboflavin biosynthesis pyrimidine reductase